MTFESNILAYISLGLFGLFLLLIMLSSNKPSGNKAKTKRDRNTNSSGDMDFTLYSDSGYDSSHHSSHGGYDLGGGGGHVDFGGFGCHDGGGCDGGGGYH